MTHTTTLAVGTVVCHDGETYTVVALDGAAATLSSGRGTHLHIGIAALIGDSSTSFPMAGPPSDPAIGPTLAGLKPHEADTLRDRVGHVQELLTGFRSGNAATAGDDEPRSDYHPGRPLMERYQAKSAEIGVGASTLRRWVRLYLAEGPAGLVDRRGTRGADPLAGIDQRWLDVCRAVIDEHTDASRPTQQLLLERVEARVADLDGPEPLPRPSARRARRALKELTAGTNALVGSTKAKRSIANRPRGTYGRLPVTRPGEYLLLDTTRLDVFGMDRQTLCWINLELTVAMDLYSRCIVGLRLSPVSTQAIDAALILYEALTPRSEARTDCGVLPYAGIPNTVVIDADLLEPNIGHRGLPSVAPETLIVDHGKIFLSDHLSSVCARLGISIQPARPLAPTDKAAVERFFRTIREDLLVALPGYKGPDIHSRGKAPEQETYFFIHELEQLMREWVATRYHQRPHSSLIDPAVPGLTYSPAEMFDRGVATAGRLRVPLGPSTVYDFLRVAWRKVQHYGVHCNGLRYKGDVLKRYTNRTSPYASGDWPIRYDPDDVSRAYFQDPNTGAWHTLVWEHAHEIGVPFSKEALTYARRLAAAGNRPVDDRRALHELLDRWGVGLTHNRKERRIALRVSQQRDARVGRNLELEAETAEGDGGDVVELIRAGGGPPSSGNGAESSDDDLEDELAVQAPDDVVELTDDEYYADALKGVR